MIRRGLREGMDFVFGELTVQRYPRDSLLTASTTVSDAGVTYPVDTSGGAVTVTLASSLVADGTHLAVKDEGGAAGTNAITIATEGGETVDGAASQDIASNYGSMALYSDGVDWFIRSSTGGGGTL